MSRILQITDLHLAARPNKVSNVLNTHEIFENAIKKIQRDLPMLGEIDAVLVTGDISDKGDLASYEVFKAIIDQLQLPYFVIPGNHDKREPLRQCFRQHQYLPHSGELNWVHSLRDFTLIGLDSTIPDRGEGELSKDTLAFLSDALHRQPDKPALVALHHPPFMSGIPFMDNIRLGNSDCLARIIEQSNQDIRIVCGHLHNSIVCNVGGATVISSPAIASAFLTDYRENAEVGFVKSNGGYMLHDWNNGFRSSFISLDLANEVHPF
ncbi:phosphodiesterase [Vibrio sp. S9_S30]|uniref:phosphodiesterase n=1 Tax=Vibrio sp. S9_S30 TaxID=2720226 RepID=UPI0016800841|nr:phosphodiesterase [Vibrio sp. S9_S30]MBD1557792.1 phosphodiesterase [Vibrio sp. S9_S30]